MCNIALEAAAEMDIPLQLGMCAGQIWQEAEEQGLEHQGTPASITFLEIVFEPSYQQTKAMNTPASEQE